MRLRSIRADGLVLPPLWGRGSLWLNQSRKGSDEMTRTKFQQRTFRLVGRQQVDGLLALVRNLPIDAERPLEVVIREEKRKRGVDQNALYWAGPLRDIADQAWVDGRQYSAEVWHEYFKREFLPDGDSGLTRDGYRKWAFLPPDGPRVLIGSTTQLTVKGMAEYLEQVYAYGASLGVQFTEHRPWQSE